MPLLSGWNETAWAPTLLVLAPRNARKVPSAVERQLGVHREVAALVVGQERLPPLARPLHGPAEAPRRPGDQRELRIAAVARPEVSAHFARHHAHRALRDAERAGHAGLGPSQAPRAGMDGVAAARGSQTPTAARGSIVTPVTRCTHVSSRTTWAARANASPRRRRRRPPVDAHVRGGVLVEDRRAGSGGGDARRHRGQRRPLHAHALGAIARRRGASRR